MTPTLFTIVGVVLIVTGLFEFFLFRWMAPRKPNIARRMPLLIANSVFNVVLGGALAAWPHLRG